MQIYLLAGIIFECIVLLLLAVLKKLTRKTFFGIVFVSVVCTMILACLQIDNDKKNNVDNQRESLYIAARLLQEDYKEEALDALSAVIDTQCKEYQVQTLRGLVLNQNEYYNTAALYVEMLEDEMAKKIYEASMKNSLVDETDKEEILEKVISLLAVSDKEVEAWEAKLKLFYIDANFDKVKEHRAVDVLTFAKAAIKDNQYREAYIAMSEAAQKGGLREDVIVSDMYVKNYNLRTMREDDSEYDALWSDITQLQARLNTLSVQIQKEKDNSSEEQNSENGNVSELEKEYRLVYADYRLAQQYMTDESIGRALNYLEYAKPEDYQTNIGYQLQMSKLYFLSRQEDLAKTCLDRIFAVDEINQDQWLGTDAYLLREAYLLYLSDTSKAEYKELFEQMMNHLYQGIFEEESYKDFGDFVTEYLHSIFSGIVIIDTDTEKYPEMTVNVSCINEDIIIDQDSVTITDTNQEIDEFQITEKEVNDLSICFVLDRSGSMSGNSIKDAKKAIQQCVMSLGSFVKVSLVSFDHEAQIDCGLTEAKYLVMSKLEGIKASGGTDIVKGLTTAYDTLASASGKRVIILLSDGHAGDSGLTEILSQLNNEGIEVYSIGLQGCDETYLQRVANDTDGKYISVTNTGELGNIYQEIQKSLIHVYTITYTNTETEQDPRYFKIRNKDSLVQAKMIYTQKKKEKENINKTYNEEEQSADYYKQTGGSKEGIGR